MTIDPLKILTKRFRTKSWILMALLAAYLCLTLVIFFKVVVPSFAQNTTSEVFAVDSTVYVYMADSLREGRNEPWVLASLYSFPNTLWTPVFVSLILNSAFLTMLLNYALFALSIWLLKKSIPLSLGTFLPLILLNPMTTTSLLCVNKEIVDLFAVSLFLYSKEKRNITLFLVAFGVALLNRYEICAALLAYQVAESRLNPWRGKRLTTVFLVVLVLNFVMPVWKAEELARRALEAESGRTIVLLNTMQIHYLYVLAVIPKILENLFGDILNPLVWETPSSWMFIMFFNNVANAILILISAKRRLLTLRNDFIYFGALGAVVVAQSLVFQPRYFYFVYVLLCLQIAHVGSNKSVFILKRDVRSQSASMLGNEGVSLG